MIRNQLLALLACYQPDDAQQIDIKHRIITFVQQHPDCFERSLLIGHVTASAWLVNKHQTQALLLHHAKLNRWVQPGGHCDGVSDVCAVAIKEAQEESGVMAIEMLSHDIFDLDIHRILARGDVPAHDHYDIRFLVRITDDSEPKINDESKAFMWVSREEPELPVQGISIARMFTKWKKIPIVQPVRTDVSKTQAP